MVSNIMDAVLSQILHLKLFLQLEAVHCSILEANVV